MIGWKDDAIRLYDVILYGMESQEGDSLVGGMIWKLMQESVFENINAWLIGTAAVTLVGSVLVTLLNGKKTYVLAIVLSIVTNGGLAWSMQRLSWGWKNKVDYRNAASHGICVGVDSTSCSDSYICTVGNGF